MNWQQKYGRLALLIVSSLLLLALLLLLTGIIGEPETVLERLLAAIPFL